MGRAWQLVISEMHKAFECWSDSFGQIERERPSDSSRTREAKSTWRLASELQAIAGDVKHYLLHSACCLVCP